MHGAEFCLADQRPLQQPILFNLKVRLHTKFLNGCWRQGLRLIHDDESLLALFAE